MQIRELQPVKGQRKRRSISPLRRKKMMHSSTHCTWVTGQRKERRTLHLLTFVSSYHQLHPSHHGEAGSNDPTCHRTNALYGVHCNCDIFYIYFAANTANIEPIIVCISISTPSLCASLFTFNAHGTANGPTGYVPN